MKQWKPGMVTIGVRQWMGEEQLLIPSYIPKKKMREPLPCFHNLLKMSKIFMKPDFSIPTKFR